jgi:mannose-6-phosphate isomerase-like protein (cupin superfamily)
LNRIAKSWGYEEIIYNGEYCCKLLVYMKPISSSMHFHNNKHETFVVQTGIFSIRHNPLSDDWRVLDEGDYIVLPPRTIHQIRCHSPGEIVEASTHDDPDDCVRLIPSET